MEFQYFIELRNDNIYKAREEGYYILCLDYNRHTRTNAISITGRLDPTFGFYLEGVKKFGLNKEKNNLYKKIIKENITKEEQIQLKARLKKYLSYSSVPTLGEYREGVMKDLITGKKIEYRDPKSDESINGLSYTHAQILPKKLIIEVLKLLTEEDLKRYSELINEIEEISIAEYSKKKTKVK